MGRLLQLRDWLEEHSRWNELRALGNSNLVKASVLMPAFGYMLLLNDNVHSYLTIKYDGWLLGYLPSIWRIWLLFYGSFFLAAGTLLYAWYCPVPVKRYAFGFAMADAEWEHHLNLNQLEMILGELRLACARMTPLEKTFWPDLRVGDEDPFWPGMTGKMRASNTLVYIWNVANTSSFKLRVTVFVLLWSGLFLVGLPAVFTFLQVTALAFTRFAQ